MDANGAPLDSWPLDELHFVGEAFGGAPVRLKRGAAGQARLTIDDPGFLDVLLRAAPQLRRNPNLNFRRVAGLTAGVAALVAAAIELEDGDALDIKVRVANIKHNNAFAMLGGRIVILNGLLFDARSPDGAAGVLAHEIGHVMRQHPSRTLLRGIGLGLVFDLFLGGSRTAGFGQTLLSTSYSRDAERDADAIALAILDGAGVSVAGLAEFLDRLNDGGAGPDWLSTHPDSKNRAALIRAHQGPKNTTPALTQADWRALNGICQQTPKG